MNALGRQWRSQQLGRAGKPQAGLAGLNDALALRKIGWSLVQHDDAGLAGQRLGRRGNVLGEDQLEGTGTLDGVNSLDLLLLLTGNQLAAQRVD